MNLEKLHQHRNLVFFSLTLIAAVLVIAMVAAPRFGFFGLITSGVFMVTLLSVRDVLWHASKPDQRQSQLRDVANTINFSFTEQTDHNPFGFSESFLLTQKGVKTAKAIEGMMITKWLVLALPKFRNLFQRNMDDMTVSVFDYEYSEGDETPTIRQTVFAIRSTEFEHPHLALCPATTWDRVAAMVSVSVQTQRGYRLTGDENALEMTAELAELLDGFTCIEAGEGYLLMYQRGVLVPPHQIEGFIKEGLLAYATVTDARQVTSSAT